MIAVLSDTIGRWPRLLRWALAILLPLIGLAVLGFTWMVDTFDLCLGKPGCDPNRFGDEPLLWLFYVIGADLVISPLVLTAILWRRP